MTADKWRIAILVIAAAWFNYIAVGVRMHSRMGGLRRQLGTAKDVIAVFGVAAYPPLFLALSVSAVGIQSISFDSFTSFLMALVFGGVGYILGYLLLWIQIDRMVYRKRPKT